MPKVLLCLLLLCAHVGQLSAQSSAEKTVPLADAFKKITKTFGTRFVYDRDAIKNKTTTYRLENLKGAQLEDVLKAILYPNELVFLYISPNYYTIVPRNRVGAEAANAVGALPVAKAAASTAVPDTAVRRVSGSGKRMIRGQVTAADGKGIGSVTITSDKGNNAISDAAGYYTIAVNAGTQTLNFSSIGYESQTTFVANSDVQNLVLQSQINSLAEVVVVGYGEKKKVTLTGSVSTVSGKTLQQSPGTNLAQSIGGRLPGLVVANRSGLPGADDPTLLIRGLSTTGNNAPLIVIDGIVRSSFSYLDPSDIESISLLKDASAEAVFGARAANGVILVTSKRGLSGKTSITYTGNVGIQKGVRLVPTLDSYSTALLWNEAWKNEGAFNGTPGGLRGYDDATLDIIKNQTNTDRYSNTDWYKEIVGGTAPQTQHNISINGGGEKSRYFVSVGYANQAGFYSALDYKRYNVRANLDATLANNLEFSMSISGRQEERRNVNNSQIIRNALMTPRIEPIQYSNGTYRYNVPWVGNSFLESRGHSGYSNSSRTILENSAFLVYKAPFLQGLSFKGLVSFDKSVSLAKGFTRPYMTYILNDDNSFTPRPVPINGVASMGETYSQSQSITAEASASYNHSFGKHNVDGLILYTQTQNNSDILSGGRINFPSPVLDQLSMGSTTGLTNSGTGTRNARKGIVGRFGYSYNSKYLFDFSFRYDGSDIFPPHKRYGFFPAVSAGWRISEENFIRDNFSFINNLKLRASWGKAGNDRVGQFQYLTTYSIGNGAAFGGINAGAAQYLRPGVIANTDFTWEKATIQNFGLEGTLWKGLLTFEADYFYKRTNDILAPNTAIPAVIGGSLPSSNVAVVDNRGFELTIGHQNTIKNVKYHINANLTTFSSKVISYPDPAGTLNALKLQGKPVAPDAVIGYMSRGLYQSAADVAAGPTPLFSNVTAGDIRFVDTDKNGVLNANDRVIISRGATPGFIYGLNMGASYKGFDIALFFQGAADTRVNLPSMVTNSFYAGYQLLYPYQQDRWTPSNPNATFPRLTTTSRNNQTITDYFVRNADYLRLKSLEIGFAFPKEWTKFLKSGPVRFYMNASNLFTISKMKIVDPETGNDVTAYPLVKVFNAGVSIKF